MLNNGGLLEYWKEKEYQKLYQPELNKNSKSRSYHKFSLKQLQSLFYVFIVSTMISTFCLICEIIHSSFTKFIKTQ